jgi:hypothetical protein
MSYKDQRKQKDQAVALDALTAEKKKARQCLYLDQAVLGKHILFVKPMRIFN